MTHHDSPPGDENPPMTQNDSLCHASNPEMTQNDSLCHASMTQMTQNDSHFEVFSFGMTQNDSFPGQNVPLKTPSPRPTSRQQPRLSRKMTHLITHLVATPALLDTPSPQGRCPQGILLVCSSRFQWGVILFYGGCDSMAEVSLTVQRKTHGRIAGSTTRNGTLPASIWQLYRLPFI